MRMTVDNMPTGETGALGSPDIDELRCTQPVFPGDRLRMKSTIINKKESRSRLDIGTVFMYNEIFNQNGEMVTSFKLIVMFKKKQSADIFLSN
jgi:acyl dehydratase|tara:strand:+ start:1166 stop:1444 length:279 start_codon:yes stop_codon:yes gene_type:complete